MNKNNNCIFSTVICDYIPINKNSSVGYLYLDGDFEMDYYNFKEEHQSLLLNTAYEGIVYVTTDEIDYPLFSRDCESSLNGVIIYIQDIINICNKDDQAVSESSGSSFANIKSFLPTL